MIIEINVQYFVDKWSLFYLQQIIFELSSVNKAFSIVMHTFKYNKNHWFTKDNLNKIFQKICMRLLKIHFNQTINAYLTVWKLFFLK